MILRTQGRLLVCRCLLFASLHPTLGISYRDWRICRDIHCKNYLRKPRKIFNKRETQEEREDRIRREKEEREDRLRREAEEKEDARDRKRNRELSRLLAAVVQGQDSRKGDRMGERRGPRVERDQCAYCKERGHWAKD